MTAIETMSSRFAVITVTATILSTFLSGCAHVPTSNSLLTKSEAASLKATMKQRDQIIFLSSPEMDSRKPTLLLLHGATDDPTEMMDIVREWRGRYNVLLYVFNYHNPIKKAAAHLVGEMKALRAQNIPLENMTVITYSYSAAVFRKAVLIADDRTLFSGVSLVQLVPTAGGSYLARGMKNRLLAMVISLASKPSAAENPYGRIAAEIWGEDGSRKFSETINPRQVCTVLIEGDPHSLANCRNEEVQTRYQNGIGTNVVVIPKSAGATHEYFPTEPVALGYLRNILEADLDATVHDRDRMASKIHGAVDR